MRKALIFLLVIVILCSSVPNTSFAAIVIPTNDNVILPGNPDPAKVKAATDEFKNLSKKEKNERIKDVKELIRHYKAAKKNNGKADTNTLLLCILAIILPPLAVYLHEGEINSKFWICLLLSVLLLWVSPFFWSLGVIYALIVILGGTNNSRGHNRENYKNG